MTSTILEGERFGDLVVLGPCADAPRRRDCLCDCGRPCTRSSAALRRGRRLGAISACDECNRELRRGHVAARREAMRDHLRLLWEESRTLYGHTALANLYNGIRDDSDPRIEEEGSAYEGHLPVVFDGLPIRERHEPAASLQLDGDTLESIGHSFGLSRERIRAIETDALRRLAKSKLLRELHRGEPPPSFSFRPTRPVPGFACPAARAMAHRWNEVHGRPAWSEQHDAALQRAVRMAFVRKELDRLELARTNADHLDLTAQARVEREYRDLLNEWLHGRRWPPPMPIRKVQEEDRSPYGRYLIRRPVSPSQSAARAYEATADMWRRFFERQRGGT